MKSRINEHDEFLLSQLMDGDLPVDQAASLRKRLAEEPELRLFYESLCRVDRMLKSQSSRRLDIDLGSFHQGLMHKLADEVPVSEQDEYLLGQLLDGELNPADEANIRKRLKTEPALHQRYTELNSLDAAMAQLGSRQPSVDYGHFHQQLMDRVATESQQTRGVLIRFPLWLRITAPIAVAASILLAVLLQPMGTTVQPGPSIGTHEFAANTAQSHTQEASPALLTVVVATPSRVRADAPEALDIQVSRPSAQPEADGIQVSYARDTQIAEAIRQADTEQANRPSRKVFFTAVAVSPTALGEGDLF